MATTGAQEPAAVIDRSVRLKEAARLARKSTDTIRRRLWEDKVPGAYRDGDGREAPWVIPVAGLVEAGLVGLRDLEAFDSRVDSKYHELEEQVAQLTAELAAAELRLETTERLLAQANGEVEHHRRMAERLVPAALAQWPKGA
jgi:hypothetical protein